MGVAAGLCVLGLFAAGTAITGTLTDPDQRQAAKEKVSEKLAPTSASALDSGQMEIAQTIIDIGREHSIPDAGIEIALMTAMQESSLRNLPYGDRDSLGVFQQRPSQGWGTDSQVLSVHHATTAFYGVNPKVKNAGLTQISGWQKLSKNDAAQAVQRSAHPEAYAKWEPLAADILAAAPNSR
ncbi:hypothetical protein Bravens_01772 [Brevibacterium ravenspurgense]|uniref:Peptidoglycan-binding protein n=1 Tax=Brevibacterium ravenspurgense TaxID=479117 RepID=A0A150H5A0_9MICO|nr:hypothetical protein Bravens_01772 [Brevibacterium ravenspurgense]